ncbi:MAG: LysM domain/BON superfamily [Beijerinckiaceae bacterium]|nr:MAG: LysM domain/BON superfamily [Beijerinckiaceae bacterium]
MGLFNFIKSVGNKVFGASEAQAAPADQLAKEVAKHGLNVDGLDIQVAGNKITVGGSTTNTAEAEKIILALGNTLGVSEVESKLIVAQEVPAATMYEVKSGDTLWKIAEMHYGKGKGGKYDVIFEANKPMLSHPDKIYPHQMLRIPPLA